MFNLDVDGRLEAWSNLRKQANQSQDPLLDIAHFWQAPPFIGYNPNIDPFYQASWPTPWEIVVQNKYDDFTRAVMIGYTILLTDRFKESDVQIQTLVDEQRKKMYNVVCVDNTWILNYIDGEVVTTDKVPSLYRLENLVELKRPR